MPGLDSSSAAAGGSPCQDGDDNEQQGAWGDSFGEGDRAVCAPPLRKAPCAAATAAWGVANVYC